MAHVINTSIAAVKISGSFSATNFSSSEDEGEDVTTQSRRRSNAFLNTHNQETDVPTTHQSKSRSAASDSGHVAASDSDLSCTTERSSSSTYATALSSPSHIVDDTVSPDKNGSSQQRPSTIDECQTASELHNDIFTHQNNELGESVIQTNEEEGSKNNRNPETAAKGPTISDKTKSSSSLITTQNDGSHVQNSTDNTSLNSGASPVSSPREMYYQSRFNPFDREIHLEEDHFSDNPEGNLFGRDSSSPASALSSHSSGQERFSLPGDTDKVTFAELGLAEDHFSHPEGHFGFSKTEELEMAIDNCKGLIRKASPNSDRQKNLVQKLVQLRLKLQELKEEPEVREKNVVLALGHRLLRKESRSTKYYCEKCNGIIWGVVQEWRKCLDCGYRCHDKCVPQITRNCAMMKA